MITDKARRNELYRQGICTDCKSVKHSAGRNRCDECHRIHAPNLEPGETRDGTYLCRGCGQNPTRPGNVLCHNCFKQLKRAAK